MAFKRMFSYAKVDVPNRSGHNVDHRHAFTAKCGTLIPSFRDFLIPGDTVDLSTKFSVQMAPQATDFIGRISLRTELFFVPLRSIWAGWKDFITYSSDGIGGPAPSDPNYHAKYLPGAKVGFNLFTRQVPLPTDLNPGSDAFLSISANERRIIGNYVVRNGETFFVLNSQQFISAYNEAVSLPDGGAYALNDLRTQRFGVFVWLPFISKIRNMVTNNDFSYFWPDLNFNLGVNMGPGSLADYLGFKVVANSGEDESSLSDVLTRAADLMQNIYDVDVMASGLPYSNLFEMLYIIASTGSFNALPFSVRYDGYDDDNNEIPEGTGYLRFSPTIQYGVDPTQQSVNITINNILPFVAYHKIFDDWHRDARLMKKLFPNALGDNPQDLLGNIAYITKYGGGFNKKFYEGNALKFYDGKNLFDLRQRLWQKDFFTTMTQAPQSGDAMKVQVTPDPDNPNIAGEFTIAALRLSNAMQLWRERNNLVDSRYGDVQYAQYGVYPDDAVTDRAIYLGSNTVEIYNKSVYQQGEYEGPSNNPIKGIGTKYATPIGVGQGNLCNNYTVKEHGILMALTSIVPEASYSSGTRRDFHYNTIDDIAFPLLQGVGDQPVFAREIVDVYKNDGDKTVIGYTGRYSEYKFINDHISGLLRDGASLSSFALQRSFSTPPALGAEFLEIPVDYLDQVSAVGVENSKYGAWIDSYWRYSKVSCLSEYNAVPTLGRMPDVHQITVTKAGSRL